MGSDSKDEDDIDKMNMEELQKYAKRLQAEKKKEKEKEKPKEIRHKLNKLWHEDHQKFEKHLEKIIKCEENCKTTTKRAKFLMTIEDDQTLITCVVQALGYSKEEVSDFIQSDGNFHILFLNNQKSVVKQKLRHNRLIFFNLIEALQSFRNKLLKVSTDNVSDTNSVSYIFPSCYYHPEENDQDFFTIVNWKDVNVSETKVHKNLEKRSLKYYRPAHFVNYTENTDVEAEVEKISLKFSTDKKNIKETLKENVKAKLEEKNNFWRYDNKNNDKITEITKDIIANHFQGESDDQTTSFWYEKVEKEQKKLFWEGGFLKNGLAKITGLRDELKEILNGLLIDYYIEKNAIERVLKNAYCNTYTDVNHCTITLLVHLQNQLIFANPVYRDKLHKEANAAGVYCFNFESLSNLVKINEDIREFTCYQDKDWIPKK